MRDGILEEPWRHQNGSLELPDEPGLGLHIDRRALRRHGHHFFKATRLRVAVSAVIDKGIKVAREAGATRDARLATRSAELDRQADLVDLALRP